MILISFSVIIFRVRYISGDTNLEYFMYIVILFVLSINFLIFIPHLIFLLIGWDGLGLTSYLLVIYYQNDKSLAAGIITALRNRIGDSLIILAICWSFCRGHWALNLRRYNTFMLTGAILIVGAITKRAQIPFSAWLPAAIAAPTPVSSLVHSSTLVTAGVYMLIRFYPFLNIYEHYNHTIFYIGVITCIIARLSALYENDLKKIIALSTLRQLGVIFIALGLNSPAIAFFHLITHALFKALLFVCAGTIIHSSQNNQDIRIIGRLWTRMPTTCTALNIANLALCGFPFIAGFYSKDLIAESVIYSNFPARTSTLIIMRICLTRGYRIRLSVSTLWNPYKGKTTVILSDERLITYIPFLILLSGGVMGGACLSWVITPFTNVIVLPLPLKTIVLSLVIIIGLSSYLLIELRVKWWARHFIGSIWFLSMITSSPGVKSTFLLRNTYYSQELRWIELIRGKGILSHFSTITTNLQKTQNLPFSNYFSLLTVLTGCLLLLSQ